MKHIILPTALLFLGSCTSFFPQEPTDPDITIEKEILLDHPVDLAWKMWTTEEHLFKWWNKGVRLEPKMGGDFYEPWKTAQGHQRLATGKVIDLKKHEYIGFTWREMGWMDGKTPICYLHFVPKGDKTLVKVVHSGSEYFLKGFGPGWDFFLGKLKKYSQSL